MGEYVRVILFEFGVGFLIFYSQVGECYAWGFSTGGIRSLASGRVYRFQKVSALNLVVLEALLVFGSSSGEGTILPGKGLLVDFTETLPLWYTEGSVTVLGEDCSLWGVGRSIRPICLRGQKFIIKEIGCAKVWGSPDLGWR